MRDREARKRKVVDCFFYFLCHRKKKTVLVGGGFSLSPPLGLIALASISWRAVCKTSSKTSALSLSPRTCSQKHNLNTGAPTGAAVHRSLAPKNGRLCWRFWRAPQTHTHLSSGEMDGHFNAAERYTGGAHRFLLGCRSPSAAKRGYLPYSLQHPLSPYFFYCMYRLP